MENKKMKNLSMIALIVSVLPLVTFLPTILKITLSDEVRGIWSGANIIFILAGLCLSIVCVRNRESRSAINIISTIISAFWMMIMIGIAVLALFLNYL